MMIRKVVLMLMLGGTVLSVQADHIPAFTPGQVQFQSRLAALWGLGAFDPMLEIQGRFQGTSFDFQYAALTVGSYFRPLRNLKVGAFYRLQAGARHDDDWVNLDPGWAWIDSSTRLEHVLILDFSPRFQLKFLPGQNWVFMLKSRYLLNTFNMQHSVLVRPGLTYFLMHNRAPLFNFTLNFDLYFPLNFGNTLLYGYWPYLNILYHIGPTVKLELSGTYKTETWSASQDLIDAGEPDWTGTRQSWVFGVGKVLTLGR